MQKAKVVEIGPRDGFQNVKEQIPTEVKLAVIDGLVDAGFKKIQIGSFVSPKAIPQMKDMKEVASKVLEKYAGRGIEFFALVPNLFGAKAAAEIGLKEITLHRPRFDRGLHGVCAADFTKGCLEAVGFGDSVHAFA